jgi:dienelactone hydrolase
LGVLEKPGFCALDLSVPRRRGPALGVRCAAVTLTAVVLGGALAGCGARGAPGQAEISASAPVALADQAITIEVTGLASGQRVTVTASATDDTGLTWESDAIFTASRQGGVNLAAAGPDSGSYQGADAMGLLSSLGLPGQANVGGNGEFAAAPPQRRSSFPVEVTVTSAGGTVLATRAVTREWMTPGESARVLTVKADKVAGVLFTPPPGTPRHPGVVLFGGAEGGMSQVYAAALLAAHGYPSLSVAYFDWPGLPSQLERIPLEYFETAGRILAAQTGTDPAHVLALGYSRGSEAALLAANYFPQVFHGAIVYSPSSFASPAQNDPGQPAWTLDGRGIVNVPIPEDDISGPVLALAGGDDTLVTDAGQSANEIAFDLASEGGDRYQGEAFVYPDAGHAVGTFPYQPITTAAIDTLGGTRAGDVAAQQAGWSKVLGLLAQLSRGGARR